MVVITNSDTKNGKIRKTGNKKTSCGRFYSTAGSFFAILSTNHFKSTDYSSSITIKEIM